MISSIFKKILVCIDGSKTAENAIYHACDLAKKYDARLYLIYVVEKSPTLDMLDRKETLKILRGYGKKVLKKEEKLCKKERVVPQLIMKEGKVSNEIIKFAQSKSCDLIVVANKGLGSALRFFLGSTSTKLVQDSKTSVLIIK